MNLTWKCVELKDGKEVKPRVVGAREAEEAAIRYVRQRDREDGLPLARSTSEDTDRMVVIAEPANLSVQPRRFSIYGEVKPVYYAEELT